jgi:hypothetical protein
LSFRGIGDGRARLNRRNPTVPSAVLRTLHAAEPGDVIVFTHGDVVTDVWYRDHRPGRAPFINALPIDAVSLAANFRGWNAGPTAAAFVEAATDGTVHFVEDGTGELLVGIRCYGEWWESVPKPYPFTLETLPWGPDDALTATDEVTLHRQYLHTMSRSAHVIRP